MKDMTIKMTVNTDTLVSQKLETDMDPIETRCQTSIYLI